MTYISSVFSLNRKKNRKNSRSFIYLKFINNMNNMHRPSLSTHRKLRCLSFFSFFFSFYSLIFFLLRLYVRNIVFFIIIMMCYSIKRKDGLLLCELIFTCRTSSRMKHLIVITSYHTILSHSNNESVHI